MRDRQPRHRQPASCLRSRNPDRRLPDQSGPFLVQLHDAITAVCKTRHVSFRWLDCQCLGMSLRDYAGSSAQFFEDMKLALLPTGMASGQKQLRLPDHCCALRLPVQSKLDGANGVLRRREGAFGCATGALNTPALLRENTESLTCTRYLRRPFNQHAGSIDFRNYCYKLYFIHA